MAEKKQHKEKKLWKNSIVGHDEVDPNSLMPNPENWRLHGDFQQKTMNSVLSEVGWITQVIVNKTTGRIVDGHLRVKLAIERGEETVPVTYVELSEDDEKKALLTFDPVSSLADGDISMFTNLSDDINTDSLWVRELLQRTSENITGERDELETPDEDESSSQKEIEGMELSAFEHYDYVVMMFKTDQDFLDACDYFEIKKVQFESLSGSKKVGMGRVIDGSVAMRKIRGNEDGI